MFDLVLAALFGTALAHAGASASPHANTEENPPNLLAVKAAFIHVRNREREAPSAAPAEPPDSDHMAGFMLSYERVLVPERLNFELSKPFYFGEGRLDSPLELFLKASHGFGVLEGYVGAGLTFNVRLFKGEREDIEGTRNDLSFGLATTAGVQVRLSERVRIEAEAGYGWIPVGDVTKHEVSAALGPALAF